MGEIWRERGNEAVNIAPSMRGRMGDPGMWRGENQGTQNT